MSSQCGDRLTVVFRLPYGQGHQTGQQKKVHDDGEPADSRVTAGDRKSDRVRIRSTGFIDVTVGTPGAARNGADRRTGVRFTPSRPARRRARIRP
jgi:hypothetical protein